MIRRTISTTRIIPPERIDQSYLTFVVLVIIVFGSIFIVELSITIKRRQLKLLTAHRRPATESQISNQTDYNFDYPYPPEDLNKAFINAAKLSFDSKWQMLWKTCKKYNLVEKYQPTMEAFIILPALHVTWCNTFISTSRSSAKYFINLDESDPNEQSTNYLRIRDYLSYLTVSDPFERLLMGYRNLLEYEQQSVSTKYKLLRKEIVEKFGSKSNVSSELAGPTFREFLLYVVKYQNYSRNIDVHWSPIYQTCAPCTVNFTIFAKAEAIRRDIGYMIEKSGSDKIFYSSRIDDVVVLPEIIKIKYFSQIDRALLREVYKMYELDFELFGYNSETYIDYLNHSSVTMKPPKRIFKG